MFAIHSAMPRALALAAVAMCGTAAPAHAGPPWISIEMPANPLDPTSRGALLLVHAFHHGSPIALPVSGTAEGLVDGRRRTVTLAFTPTSRPGVYALRYEPPREGSWMLVIRVTQGSATATAFVALADGAVASVRVPTVDRGGPAQVSARDVEEALREHAS
jgi:hypothetical protein